MKKLNFPENFQWSVSTAGHQVEGDNIHSDWWQWEQQPGRIKNGERSGKASYHMERLEEDIELMKQMNVKTYRFSIEWSRIEPEEGRFSDEAISYYLRKIQLLKKSGIRPMVTMHHFVSPQWFSKVGGWRQDNAAEIFFRYAERVEKEFGNEIEYWVTFNEPTVLLNLGYGLGLFPPGETEWNFWAPMVNIMKAHAKTYHHLHKMAKAQGRSVKVGIAHHLRPLLGKGWMEASLVRLPDFIFNWNIPQSLKTGVLHGATWKKILGVRIPIKQKLEIPGLANTQDFVGINYYCREYIALTLKPPFFARKPLPGTVCSDLDWSVDPEGFFVVFKLAHEMFPDIPFFVTENGLADAKDALRPSYIVSHLREVHRAMTDLPHVVEGYCHWSLMDNFEWHDGFGPRFGLIEVDYQNNGERRPRASYNLMKAIYGSNSIEVDEA